MNIPGPAAGTRGVGAAANRVGRDYRSGHCGKAEADLRLFYFGLFNEPNGLDLVGRVTQRASGSAVDLGCAHHHIRTKELRELKTNQHIRTKELSELKVKKRKSNIHESEREEVSREERRRETKKRTNKKSTN